jgi:hypothetical protein
MFSEWINQGEKTHPECGLYHPHRLGVSVGKKGKRRKSAGQGFSSLLLTAMM